MRRLHAAVLGCILAASVAPPAAAYPRPGRVERIAVSTTGEPGTQFSQYPDMTPDGRFVAFASESANLAPHDTNEQPDVFVRDRLLGTTERVSLSSEEQQGNGISTVPSISADGRYVAFASAATNLSPDVTRQEWQIYVRDRQAGTTEIVSVAADGLEGNEASSGPVLSANGRYVAFDSFASNLVPGDVNQCALGASVRSCVDIFVRDRQTGSTELVSQNTEGTNGNGWSSSPDISADGRLVVFHSESDNLVPGDTNLERDVFVRDRAAGTLERVSVASDGTQGNDRSVGAAISADGRVVAFESGASNLVPRDTNGVQIFVGTPIAPPDVFVHDLATGTTERVVGATGAEPNDWTIQPALSADGRFVAFHSMAGNLVPGDTNETMDIFVHDRVTGGVDRASVADDGTQGNHWSAWGPPDLSADGREVVFATDAWNLVPGSVEGDREVLVRDRGPVVGVGGARATPGDAVSVTGWATFSGALVASSSDPATDGGAIAQGMGAELTGASVAYRPELEDLWVRLDLSALAGVRPPPPYPVGGGLPGWAGLPAILYGAELRAGAVRWEARAVRPASGDTPGSPTLTLHRCQETCAEVGVVQGSYGNGGDSVAFSIPLAQLGLAEEAAVEMRAFTALGDRAPGSLLVLDQVDLGSATLPTAAVQLTAGPRDGEPPEEGFGIPATLEEGGFSGSLDLGPGQAAWVRACLGTLCGVPVRAEG